MRSKEVKQKIVASGLFLIAVIVGCASDPANKTEESKALSITPSIILAEEEPDNSLSNADQSQKIKDIEKQSQLSRLSQDTMSPVLVDTAPENFDNSDQFINGKKLSIPKVTGSVPPRDDEYHDTDNNAIVTLQSPTLAMAKFPRDRRKEVDWVKTLDEGFIEPRANLTGGDEMLTMDLDIVMKNTQFMPWVKFPHLAHTKWLACQNCHPKIFKPQEHANPISMNKVLRGEFCGVCHDKVSFSLFICERCHSVPHEGSGPAWWKEN